MILGWPFLWVWYARRTGRGWAATLFKKMESHPLAAQHPRYYGDSGWLKLRKPKPEDIDQIIFEIACKRRIPFREYERLAGQ